LLLMSTPLESELEGVPMSKYYDEAMSKPQLSSTRERAPPTRYQRGHDLGTDGRFASMPRKPRAIQKRKRVASRVEVEAFSEEENPPTLADQSALEQLQTDTSASGCYGVTISNGLRGSTYVARVRRGSASDHIGTYQSMEEAAAAVLKTTPGKRFARQKKVADMVVSSRISTRLNKTTYSDSDSPVCKTGRSVHWSVKEDAKLHLVMKKLLGKNRYGANRKRVNGSVWRAVASAMGYTADIERGAKRCLRHWFLTDPSNTAVVAEMRKRDNKTVRQRKYQPIGIFKTAPLQAHTPVEDNDTNDNTNDGLANLFDTVDPDALFSDIEEVSIEDFADLCFEDVSEDTPVSYNGPDLTTDETLPSPEYDNIPFVVNVETCHKWPVKNAVLAYTFSITNLGKVCAFENDWKQLVKPDAPVSPPVCFATETAAAAAFVAAAAAAREERARRPTVPAHSQSPSPPIGLPIATPETPQCDATLAPPMVQETLDSYLRICKGLASMDQKTLALPSTRLLIQEFDIVAMRVVAASSPFPLLTIV
jgi:hypothetical protein